MNDISLWDVLLIDYYSMQYSILDEGNEKKQSCDRVDREKFCCVLKKTYYQILLVAVNKFETS